MITNGFHFNAGLEVNFYAMDWQGSGLYRFGLLDRYILPSEEENCGLFEEAYCVLNEVKVFLPCRFPTIVQSCLCYILVQKKLLQMERLVKELYFENMRGKRRQ